ncbi:hypothetical protein CGRA01v4_00909 [Colletotrichum graminicola]|nr:hypothetical protein CGRA01v4_00909 [Colletotrichum graminicola]
MPCHATLIARWGDWHLGHPCTGPGRGRTSRLVLAELWSLGPLGPVPAGWKERRRPMRLSVITRNGTQNGYLMEHAYALAS